MRAAVSDISERKAFRLFGIPRSGLYRQRKSTTARANLFEELVDRLKPLIQAYPTYGYPRLWALLRFRHRQIHNRKAV